MSFADKMERLGQKISEAREDWLQSFREKAQHARATRRDFGARVKKEISNTVDELASNREAIAEELRSFLADWRDRFQREANSLRKKRKNFVARIKEETDRLRSSLSEESDSRRKEMEALRGSREQFRAVPRKRPPEREGQQEKVEQAPPEQEKACFYQEVLETIQDHPEEGIRLVQIGKEIDQEWQALIAPANQLVEEGKVRKDEDRVYFPAE